MDAICLLVVSVALSLIYHRHSRFSIPLYSVRMKPVLALHIFSGLNELLGLYIRPLLAQSGKIPDALDLILCLTQSGTNLALVKTMARGQWKMTRPSYQAGAIMRPILTILAMIYRRADLHTCSLQIIHAFIYTRCLIYIWWKANLLDKHSDIHMVAVFTAAVLAMADTDCPAILSKAYILCVAGISLLNHWASKRIRKPASERSVVKQHMLSLLLCLGFVDLPTLESVDPPQTIEDDYCDDLAIQELICESRTAAQKAVNQVSQIPINHRAGSQDNISMESSTTHDISSSDARPSLWAGTGFSIIESTFSYHPTDDFEQIPMDHLLGSMGGRISTCITVISPDSVANTDDIPRLLNIRAPAHSTGRASRWRSLLSLREKSSSSALGISDDTLKRLEVKPQIQVHEIELSDDRTQILEPARPCESRKTKRLLLREMMVRLKRVRKDSMT
jgi:hypothetical protein